MSITMKVMAQLVAALCTRVNLDLSDLRKMEKRRWSSRTLFSRVNIKRCPVSVLSSSEATSR
jgi:hypothetical protein